MTVAALYVQPGGVYYGLPDVEPWGLPERDAREYPGPHPVVAHPPCHLWVNFAALNYKRYGYPAHLQPGNDGGSFASALRAVRTYGGVLEHPAGSNAWKRYGLLRPAGIGWWAALRVNDWGDGWLHKSDAECDWVCEVWQSAYGHAARKRTWLYCRLPKGASPPQLDWSRNPGTHQCGWFDRIKPTLSKRDASATPPAFRDVLLSIARSARPSVSPPSLDLDRREGGEGT